VTTLELGRLARLRAQLESAECDAGVFYDPTNIRYATGVSNMQVYALHNPCRYAFVPVVGPVVLFDFKGCEHLSDAHETVDEVRNAVSWYHFITGPRTKEFAGRWADEIATLLRTAATGSRPRIAVDRLDPYGLTALTERGVDVVDGQEIANFARVIKTSDELAAIDVAMAASDVGITTMRDALEPGVTEQELWSELHRSNIALGGEWFETRLLTSGPRTNPWYQECADRVIEAGDLVAFDTDLIGVGGYSIDVSRTWIAGDADPTPTQSEMYAAAHEQVTANIDLLRPGLSFREFAQHATIPPPGLHSPTNAALAHGIGLCNEYPLILNRELFDDGGYDGVIEENMVLCIESLVAPVGGHEAVKLEQQVVVTASGARSLSTTPFHPSLREQVPSGV
jgi:Xaa-Pro dipeptidase